VFCGGVMFVADGYSTFIAMNLIAGSSLQVWNWTILSVDHVIDPAFDCTFSPQVSFAAAVGPRAQGMIPIALLPKPASSVCFEGIQRPFRRLRIGRYDNMYVIGPDVHRV
jgi:hypothetical protein